MIGGAGSRWPERTSIGDDDITAATANVQTASHAAFAPPSVGQPSHPPCEGMPASDASAISTAMSFD